MDAAKREIPSNRQLTNPTEGNRAKVESPTTPMQSTAIVTRALLNGGRKNRDE
jgi:hypothetical protein